MQGDTIHALEGLSPAARVRRLQDVSTRLRAVRDQVQQDLTSTKQEIEVLVHRQEVLQKVIELYRVLMDRMLLGQVRNIEAIVSEGLRTIFFDQNLSFKAEVSSKYNKVSVDFFICVGDPEHGGIKGSPLDSFGGGPTSIASLILRILTLLRLRRKKLLLLDETLAAVSDDYIETTAKFLQKLAIVSGLTVLLVTHKAAYLEHAKTAYQGDSKESDGHDEFVIKKLRGAS